MIPSPNSGCIDCILFTNIVPIVGTLTVLCTWIHIPCPDNLKNYKTFLTFDELLAKYLIGRTIDV